MNNIFFLLKAESDLKKAKHDKERYQCVYGGTSRASITEMRYQKFLSIEIPRLEKLAEDWREAISGREVDSCRYRVKIDLHKKQSNALRSEVIEPERFRCMARLKKRVQEIAERTGLSVFEPIDFEPCCKSEKCYIYLG